MKAFYIIVVMIVGLMRPERVAGDYTMDETCLYYNGFIGDPSSCNKYGWCNGNVLASTNACPTGYNYNMGSQTCTPTASTICRGNVNDTCSLTTASVYVPNPSNCNEYCQCQKGVMVGCANCPQYQIFDPQLTQCVWDTTPNICQADSICRLLPDYSFAADPDSTTCGYVVCKDGIGVPGACPTGYFFNPATGSCSSSYTCTGAAPSAPGDAPTCAAEAAYYPAGDTPEVFPCGAYYSCSATSTTAAQLMTCPFATHFDGTDQCVSPASYACAGDRCNNINMQFMTVINSGCVEYVVCDNQTTIGTPQSCPDGYFFDEIQQYCVTTIPTYPICSE